MSNNEAVVVDKVNATLRSLGYTYLGLQKRMAGASKNTPGNSGTPENTIPLDKRPDVVMLIECKASGSMHDTAISEVKHYANVELNRSGSCAKTIIAIAISGLDTKGDFEKLSSFVIKPNDIRELTLSNIKAQDFYIQEADRDPNQESLQVQELLKYAKEVHNFLRDYAKLSETEKPLMVGGALLVLSDNHFRSSYKITTSAQHLADTISATIKRMSIDAKLDPDKINSILQPFSFISVHPELTAKYGRSTDERVDKPLLSLLMMLENKVLHTVLNNRIDLLAVFYHEFLRYTGGDKKGLGIVLTPSHITELFCKLANLTVNDVVLDPCCGTGGFLIAAMDDMIAKAGDDLELQRKVRANNLIGSEQAPNMFALAAVNMMLAGDGKANLKSGNCFSFRKEFKDHKPTVGMINPPYSQKGENLSELDFVKFMLDCLETNGVGIAIVPMSCAISDNKLKAELLKEHTLEAVMTMPVELFYPVGVNTCIMVFTAHKPHDVARATWFAKWQEDGFIKTKTNGRVAKTPWVKTLAQWISDYKNRVVTPGYSATTCVDANMEWCAEAYLETDYSEISSDAFVKVIRDYMLFQLGQV